MTTFPLQVLFLGQEVDGDHFGTVTLDPFNTMFTMFTSEKQLQHIRLSLTTYYI